MRETDGAEIRQSREQRKKARELALAHAFLQAAGLRGSLEPREPPDFLLTFESGERVALELTDLTDPVRAASTSAMERAARSAEALLAGVPVAAFVNWRIDAIVRPMDVARLAEELAAAVRQAYGRRNDTVRGKELRAHAQLARLADDLVLFQDPEGPSVHALGETHWLLGDEDAVQRAISAKTEKVSSYRATEPGVPVWLLIACASRLGDANVPDLFDPRHMYETTFDRVAAFDAGTRTVKWLRTKLAQ